jgi:hypothetical protein
VRVKRYGARWLLLLIFFVGYIATFSTFEGFALEYFGLTMVSFFACGLLLSRLNRPLHITLPFWTIFVVFMVAYFFKFYLIAVFPEVGEDIHPIFALAFLSSYGLISAYGITTTAFCAFCLTSWFLIDMSLSKWSKLINERGAPGQIPTAINSKFISFVWAIIVVLILVTTGLMYLTGITMGVETPYFPFRLAGLVVYTRTVLITGLLLLIIWIGLVASRDRWVKIGVILLLFHGLGDMVMRSSKGGLAVLILPLASLFLTSGRRVRKAYILSLGVTLLLVILLYPIVSQYRFLRMGDPENIFFALSNSLEVVGGGLSSFWLNLIYGCEGVLFRLTGIEFLVAYAYLGVQPLEQGAWSVLTSPLGMPGYVTFNILRQSPGNITSIAPSMVGWFYLVGGNVAVALGLIGFTLVTDFLWTMLRWIKLQSLRVAQALFLSLLFFVTIDGVLEGLISEKMLVYPATIVICEWLMRRIVRSRIIMYGKK